MVTRTVSLTVLIVTSALAVQADGQARDATWQWQRGQTAYIVAFTNDGKAGLTAESEVTKAFQKAKAFKLTNNLDEADFVFALFGDYTRPRDSMDRGRQESGELMTGAVGMVLTRDDYRAHKGDLEALRGAAMWRELVSTGGWGGVTIIHGRSTLPGKVVGKFHDAALKKK